MRYVLVAVALLFPACGDDTGSKASGGSGGTSGSGGSGGGGGIDAPVVDAPAPDAPNGMLHQGDPCGRMPGLDGGVIPGDCMPGLLCCLDASAPASARCPT